MKLTKISQKMHVSRFLVNPLHNGSYRKVKQLINELINVFSHIHDAITDLFLIKKKQRDRERREVYMTHLASLFQ